MKVKNSLNELDKIYEKLTSFLEMHGISQDLQNDLCLCMDEVFSNIVKYAYDDNKEHQIEIKFIFDEHSKKLTIIIQDDGKAFNPLEVSAPELFRDLPDREIGGLGVFIVSNIMSRVKYSRVGQTNKLEMTKDID